MRNFRNLFNNGIISFYGYSYTNLPNKIVKTKNERINIFFKDNQFKKLNNNNSFNLYTYFGYKGVSFGNGDIVFLDQDAVKSLCLGYPTNAKLVLVSLRFFKYYAFILIGLLRRIINKSISIKGLIWLTINSKKIPWILIENIKVKNNSFPLSSKLGINGLLSFLSKEKISYVVPRFYSTLPDLNLKNTNLVLLVDNTSIYKLNKFLESNPGSIIIDVYTDVGLSYHGTTYFPPHKAKEILNRSIKGPGNSKIPNRYDSLLLLIYHVLYHKGFSSGLPSSLVKAQSKFDNKYIEEISKFKKDLNISIGNTLEELDDFMSEKGWRPAIDTLTKISEWNEWVLQYHIEKEKSKTPLYILVLKNLFIGTNAEDLLIKECNAQNLLIIEERILSEPFKTKSRLEIRGGVWNDSLDSDKRESDYYPGKIFVIWDRIGLRPGGFSYVKEILRKKIDKDGPSFIHSSDNYKESLDYIKICMPDKFSFYQDENSINSYFSKYNIKNTKLNQLIPRIKSFIKTNLIKIFSH